ncbi:molybdenum cofactor guanylyltransferase [Paenibacillus tianjinensis]|uniref:Probable molybdenum cofactor guanylyltransferase n=1 Tax=Paenibacillus tianjinensis TaxID=2810347 RepID=A0ABX7LC19_9BACL|nr:molybdenum cofactor guanylyltransferase [Paenibacillus tianjinensis]QSF44806.1 molybdenum cofactor guanylyltransferase [Paenibacillus tianjinensis]
MPQYTGILLTGGASRRMGRDKALLELAGRPVIARLADELSSLAGSTVIACGPRERREYSFLGLPQIADEYQGCGPLAGLHAALTHSRNEWNLVAACDLPFASAEFLQYILRYHAQAYPQGSGTSGRHGADAAVAVSCQGRVQPLLGLYHKRVLPALEAALSAGNFKVTDFLEKLDVLYVPETGFSSAPLTPSPLYNMNTPEDYAAAVLLAHRPANG